MSSGYLTSGDVVEIGNAVHILIFTSCETYLIITDPENFIKVLHQDVIVLPIIVTDSQYSATVIIISISVIIVYDSVWRGIGISIFYW